MEWQKLFLSIIPFPRSRPRGRCFDRSVAQPGDHNGLAFQMIDEVRHSTIQMNLKREYMKNYIDPAGFDITEGLLQQLCGDHRPSVRRGLHHRRRDHGVQHLPVVGRDGLYEHPVRGIRGVAPTATPPPTVFLSVQPESRHMATATARCSWRVARREQGPDRARHALRLVEQPRGGGRRDRHVHRLRLQGPAKDARATRRWKRWVYDDLSQLPGAAGEVRPERHDLIESRGTGLEQWYVHRGPVLRHRLVRQLPHRPDDREDFEWFEHSTPAGMTSSAEWWEHYRNLSEPATSR